MENQHRAIVGYRELSRQEIDLMNEAKELGTKIEVYLGKVEAHLQQQQAAAGAQAGAQASNPELTRLAVAQPRRWHSIAKTDFQTALMALIRSIAQPTTFS